MGYRPLSTFSVLAIAGVGIVGFLHIPAVIVGVAQVLDPSRSFGDAQQSFSVWLILQGIFALLQFVSLVGAAIVFLMWLHRGYTNLTSLGSTPIDFTPGWAVGWWFIPFANLVKPFQTVRYLWSESDPDIDPQDGTFLASVQAGAPGFMTAWWVAWILGNIASNITSKLYDPGDMRTTELSGYFFVIDGILWIVAAALAVKVIRTITLRQEQRHERLGARAMATPPPPPTFHGNPD